MNLLTQCHRLLAPAAITQAGIALALVALIGSSSVFAEGTTERERTMSRYTQCQWTDAMSKQVYECVKRNNGFNTHWCFDETVETNCEPDPLPAAATENNAAPVVVAQASEAKMDEVQMIDAEDLSEYNVSQEAEQRIGPGQR